MAVNKRKILDAARKHAQKGAKQKALKGYNALLKLDARDAKLRLEVGDVHRRWGEHDEAIGHYTKVADQYVQDGFDARAVAVYKQILNLDPKRYSACIVLADLYQRIGLEAEAMGALQMAADGYHREGQKREALELLRKMAQLDPGNTTSGLRVAELLQNEGLHDEAAREFEVVAEELLRQGESVEAENVLQRVLALQPGRVDLLIKLARTSITLHSPEGAETWAKRVLEIEESEEALELLCDVYKTLENTEGLLDASKRLARIHRDRGDEDAARTIMQRLPRVESLGDASETVEVPELAAETPDEPLAADDQPAGDDQLAGDDELLGDAGWIGEDERLGGEVFLADCGDDVIEFADVAPRGLDLEATTPIAAERLPAPGVDSDQLLAEASVYLRYGKPEQAVANLRELLAAEPGHRGGLEKLAEALAESGDEQDAVAIWSQAAERAREEDDFASFGALRGRIERLDAEAAAALPAMQSDLAAQALYEADVARELLPQAAADDDLSIDLDLSDEEFDALVGSQGASLTAVQGNSTTAVQVRDEIEEAEFFSGQGMFDEAAAAYRRILEIAPNHPSAMLRIGEIAAALGQDPTGAAELSPDGDSTLRADEVGLDVTVDISEALRSDASADPGELEDSPAMLTAPSADPAALVQAHEDDSFDLLAELSDAIAGDEPGAISDSSLQGTEEAAFTSLFSSFKRGVNEMLAEGDYETRYDLAIAYKEMGLLEDAITAFQACVGCPTRGVDSLQLLAQCALDLGRPVDAIGHLQQALSHHGLDRERDAGLRFDLGRAYADLGDLDRARATYETASDLSPRFPGLERAIAELRERSSSQQAGEAPEQADGEAFESLDDLVAEITAEAALLDVRAAPEAVDDLDPIADGSQSVDDGELDRESPRSPTKTISFD